MESVLTQLGIGGIFAILMIREVFAFLKHNKNNKKVKSLCNEECYRLVKILHDMHDQKDEDGVYIWYVRRSLAEAINKLSENVGHQTDVFRELVIQIKDKIS